MGRGGGHGGGSGDGEVSPGDEEHISVVVAMAEERAGILKNG